MKRPMELKYIKSAFKSGKKTGYDEGREIQNKILIQKINYKLKTIEMIKEDFRVFMAMAKDLDEKRYWINEITKLIEFERLLNGLRGDI
jgi:hypothetical protein